VKALALMYHDLAEPGREDATGFPGGDAASYKLTPAAFEDHLRAIAAARPSGASTIRALHGDGLPPLLLTFDDGGASAIDAADRLERHGWRGHFFVTAGYVNRPGFLTGAAVRDLHRRGHVIGSHTVSHPLRLGLCPEGRLQQEWIASVNLLADIVGEPVLVASVPGGYYTPAVAATAAQAGIRILFTSEPTMTVGAFGDLVLVGRYVMRRSTTAATAAAIARGDLAPRLMQAAAWTTKKAAKRTAGSLYLKIRERMFGRSDAIRWGDEAAVSK